MEKRLYRSRADRMVCGVCGGLAKYFDIDPVIVRVITVVLAFPGGASVLAYVILAIVVPLESSQVTEPRDVIKENVEEIKETASRISDGIRSTFVREEGTPEEIARARRRSRNVLGVIFITIGLLFLLASFNFWWFR